MPDPEPAYAEDAAPEPDTAPGPLDPDLAARITRFMADAVIPPKNFIKIANTLDVNPAEVREAIDALGGLEAVWSRARQDREAELGDTDAAYYPA
jgi:hypothetical protein